MPKIYAKTGKLPDVKNIAIRTAEEVGQILGISRQCVHQTERRAIHKIRLALAPHIYAEKS